MSNNCVLIWQYITTEDSGLLPGQVVHMCIYMCAWICMYFHMRSWELLIQSFIFQTNNPPAISEVEQFTTKSSVVPYCREHLGCRCSWKISSARSPSRRFRPEVFFLAEVKFWNVFIYCFWASGIWTQDLDMLSKHDRGALSNSNFWNESQFHAFSTR